MGLGRVYSFQWCFHGFNDTNWVFNGRLMVLVICYVIFKGSFHGSIDGIAVF